METIINDQYYEKARSFIQDHIASPLGENAKNVLVQLYETLTPENSEVVYKQAYSLYYKEMANLRAESDTVLFGYGSSILLGGLILYGTTSLLKKWVYENTTMSYLLDKTEYLSIGVSGIGIMVCFISSGLNF